MYLVVGQEKGMRRVGRGLIDVIWVGARWMMTVVGRAGLVRLREGTP